MLSTAIDDAEPDPDTVVAVVARVELARTAVEDLDRLIEELSLPADTPGRVRSCLEPLAELPRLGQELAGLL